MNFDSDIDQLSDDEFEQLIVALAMPQIRTASPAGYAGWTTPAPREIDPDRSMRPREVWEYLGIKRSMLYKMISNGRFPKPIKYTARVAVWPRNQVEDWRARQEGGPKARRGKLAS